MATVDRKNDYCEKKQTLSFNIKQKITSWSYFTLISFTMCRNFMFTLIELLCVSGVKGHNNRI